MYKWGITLIEVKNLTKYYTSVPAVNDISFSIKENGVYGFLGPNGAGKSTTMNIITGCLAGTCGSVSIGGYDIFEEPEKAKALIGYLPEQPPLYMDMTPYEYLDFVAGARRVPVRDMAAQIENALAATGLTPIKDKLIKQLSKGYKQRVGIAQTLLGDPELIILDEPTVGLDPKQITEIRELVRNLGKNHIVLFSSHILSEVQAISDHIIIIARGRIIADTRTDELEVLLKTDQKISLRLKSDRESCDEMLDTVKGIAEAAWTEESSDGRLGQCSYELHVEDPEETAEAIFFACAKAEIPILEMSAVKTTLEEAFLKLTDSLETYTSDNSEQERAIKLTAAEKEEGGINL